MTSPFAVKYIIYIISLWLLDLHRDSITFTFTSQGDKTLSAPVRLFGADHLVRICLAIPSENTAYYSRPHKVISIGDYILTVYKWERLIY